MSAPARRRRRPTGAPRTRTARRGTTTTRWWRRRRARVALARHTWPLCRRGGGEAGGGPRPDRGRRGDREPVPAASRPARAHRTPGRAAGTPEGRAPRGPSGAPGAPRPARLGTAFRSGGSRIQTDPRRARLLHAGAAAAAFERWGASRQVSNAERGTATAARMRTRRVVGKTTSDGLGAAVASRRPRRRGSSRERRSRAVTSRRGAPQHRRACGLAARCAPARASDPHRGARRSRYGLDVNRAPNNSRSARVASPAPDGGRCGQRPASTLDSSSR